MLHSHIKIEYSLKKKKTPGLCGYVFRAFGLRTKGAPFGFLDKSWYLGYRFPIHPPPHPKLGCVQEATSQCLSHQYFSPSLSFFSPLPFHFLFLKINGKNILYWGLKKKERVLEKCRRWKQTWSRSFPVSGALKMFDHLSDNKPLQSPRTSLNTWDSWSEPVTELWGWKWNSGHCHLVKLLLRPQMPTWMGFGVTQALETTATGSSQLVLKRRYLIQHVNSLAVMLCFKTRYKMTGKGTRLEVVMHSQIFCIVLESMPATYLSTDWVEKWKGDGCSGDNFLPVAKTGMKIYLWRKKQQSEGWWLPNCQSVLLLG